MRPIQASSIVVVALLVLAGCTGEDMFDHEHEVQAIFDGLHDQLGGQRGDSVYHRRTAPGCEAQLGIEDAWYERQSTDVVVTELSDDEIYRRTLDYFVDADFTVHAMRSSRSGSRGIRAVKGEIALIGDFGTDEGRRGVGLTVTAGPCATELMPFPEMFDEVEPIN